MNKEKFLKELDYLLQDIDEDERQDALNYYRDYFEDAGKEHEQDIIEELGSPERVAAMIKGGLNQSFEKGFEYSESSIYNDDYNHKNNVVENTKQKENFNERNNNILKLIVIILAVAVLLPIGGRIGHLLLAAIGIFVALLMIGLFGTIGLFVVTVVCVIAAINMFAGGLIGGGLVILAIGLLLVSLSYITSSMTIGMVKFLPKAIRSVIDACSQILHKVVK